MNEIPWSVQSALNQVVGAIVIRWSLIDSGIAQASQILWQHMGGHTSEKEPPRELSRRVRFIKDCFRTNPLLAPLAPAFSVIKAQINQIVPHRDFLVHGTLTEFFPSEAAFQFTKINATKTGHEQHSTKLSMAELLQIVGGIDECATNLITLGEKLQQLAGI